MPSLFPWRRTPPIGAAGMATAVAVALDPQELTHLPERERTAVKRVADALTTAAQWTAPKTRGPGRGRGPEPISVATLAQRAAAQLQPSSSLTPTDIEIALRAQGLDFVEPFAPGRPLVPYYGYSRRARLYDYKVGRNIGTEIRPDRIPFPTLEQVYDGYDVAQTCVRRILADLISMKLDFRAMDGYEGNVAADIREARRFLKRPNGTEPFVTWLWRWGMDAERYDCGCLERLRDRAGRLIGLKVVNGTTIAPMLDYFGDTPEPPAPAFEQFIQGIPWGWFTTQDLIYTPRWPISRSPYGVPPIETILLNANTDVRLQWFFLQFFTSGAVPEALIELPITIHSPDELAEWEEYFDDRLEGNQSGRHKAMAVPQGTKLQPYKNIDQINPTIAEYVMRRTIAAFGLMPHTLGLVADVNRSTAGTQVDEQFRVSTLPRVEYYQAILDSVLQDDLQLPVVARFDTGRDKEDRLKEAQAHNFYVSMGAESPDEVRDRVLGLEVDSQSRIPRFFDSARLGPIPLAYLVATSGQIDPTSLAPLSGTVPPVPFVMPTGTRPPDAGGVIPTERGEAPIPPHRPPFGPGGTGYGAGRVSSAGPGSPGGPPERRLDATGGQAGRSTRVHRGTQKGADLARWQRQSRDRVAKGQRPRWFRDSAIDDETRIAVWTALAEATTRETVDAAFAKATAGITTATGIAGVDLDTDDEEDADPKA